MEKMSDKEMVETIKKTANLIEDAFNGVAIDTVEKLRAAAGRITELAQEKHDILHAWYKGKEMCEICAHKCTNVEAKSCSECERECLCLVCEGENWEEARDDG